MTESCRARERVVRPLSSSLLQIDRVMQSLAEKTKECKDMVEQLASSKAAVDRMGKSLRAAKEREEELMTAKQQGELAVEQVPHTHAATHVESGRSRWL